MRPVSTKKTSNETFFGLLQAYKSNATYVRVLESNQNDCISVQISDNPGKWKNITDEKYRSFRILRRMEIGVTKLLIKFLTPSQLIEIRGPLLGIRVPIKECSIFANVNGENIHIIETALHYKERMLNGVKNLLMLSPHKKLEIIELCLHQSTGEARIEKKSSKINDSF